MTQLTFSVPFYCCIPVRFPSESLDSRFAAECQSRLQFCSGSVQCRYKVRRYRILGSPKRYGTVELGKSGQGKWKLTVAYVLGPGRRAQAVPRSRVERSREAHPAVTPDLRDFEPRRAPPPHRIGILCEVPSCCVLGISVAPN